MVFIASMQSKYDCVTGGAFRSHVAGVQQSDIFLAIQLPKDIVLRPHSSVRVQAARDIS
jgi:hypothetical protein